MTSSLLSKSINSLENLYEIRAERTSLNSDVRLLFFLRNWFLSIVVFDEKTGNNIVDDLESFLFKVCNVDTNEKMKDYVSRITDHSSAALEHIFNNPREKILREHDIIPTYAVREVDSSTVQWLSRRSGRNIREKLAEKPYLKAIKRRFSLDTTENKLVKAFVYRLEHLLILKEDLQIDEDGIVLLQIIERWLRDDMTKEIGIWSNFPPNNTLLQDKYYRKIWDSWLWIQEIDNLVQKDSENYKNNFLTLVLWSLIVELNKFEETRFIQQPVYTDYDNFSIKTSKSVHGIFYFRENTHKILCEYKNNKVKVHFDHKLLFIGEMENKEQLKVYMGGKMTYYDYSEDALLKIKNNFSKFVAKEYNLSKSKEMKKEKWLGEKIVLDVNSIYPEFIIEGNEKQRMPFRFVTQYWKNEEEQVNIDGANANALLMNPEIITISTKNLFSKKSLAEGAIFTSVLNKFTKDIANYLITDKLTYLVSDRTNEFESEKLRKSMNFAFNNADAIPRSIAGVFYWQSTMGFHKQDILSGDIVVVIEASAESISMSKLVASKNEKLVKMIPDTNGITWERHPSIDLETAEAKENFEQVLKTTLAKDIAEIWGREGVALESDKLSWVDDDKKWFTADKKYNLKKLSISIKEIQSKLNVAKNSKLKILIIGEYADLIDISKELSSIKYTTFEISDKLLEGVVQLNKWNEKINGSEIYLWRDHLPELSFNIPQDGRYQDFYLVKDTTIIPMKGNKTEIKINKLLTLPKGKNFYEFPLQMGSGNQELQFMAYLSSSALPFSKDMLCELKMIYTYGADNPYELYFVPYNKEENSVFKSIKVQWKELSNHIISNAPVPNFPKHYSWKDFKNFTDKDGGHSDLYRWMKNNINIIQSIEKFGLVTETINSEWIDRGENNIFAFTDKNTFLHQSELYNRERPVKGAEVSFYKIEKEKLKYSGYGIVEKDKKPKINFLIKSLRFPTFTMWNQGNSLSDIGVPDDFRSTMKSGIDVAMSIIENEEMPNNLKRELILFLSILHCDTDSKIVNILLEGLKKNKYSIEVSYAIGEGKLKWQQELLSNALKSSEKINILSIALWRSEALIHYLSKGQIDMLINTIITRLNKFINNSSDVNIMGITRYLEVLYALLRSRESEDKDIKMILGLNQGRTKELVEIVEKTTNKILDSNLSVETRVAFNMIEKPDTFNKTPDLLYALRMYLSGDDGANSIQVAEFESE